MIVALYHQRLEHPEKIVGIGVLDSTILHPSSFYL